MRYKLEDWMNEVKWAWQRAFRGYDDRLFWDMSEYIDPLIVAHCKHLRENAVGHPTDLTEKKWNKVLDTIILGMREEPDWRTEKEYFKYWKEREKALVLLAFYCDYLWD